MTLGWGVIGLGWAATGLVGPAINAEDDSQIVAATSRDAERAKAFGEKLGVRNLYTDYQEMLADPAVDVVYIATPNALHAEQAIAALRAGKHVLAEKPIAMNAADAEAVVAAAAESGTKLGTNFQTRHYAPVAEIKRLLDAGTIGDIVVIQAESSSGGVSPLKGWRTDADLAGMGAVYNLGVHPFDLVRYLAVSEVVEVTAMTDVGREPKLDTLSLTLLRFESGALGYVNAGQRVPYPNADVSVFGTTGRIVGVNSTRPNMVGEVRVTTASGEQVTPFDTKDGFQRAVRAFNRAVIDDTATNASGLDGVRSAELVEALTRAVREGSVVRVASPAGVAT
jgi:1,5-anhydro-D-fructose reductase (1,5-anhydro-D-mannitol-forming)